MNEETKEPAVIKIDPAGKYVIILSSRESPEAVQRAKQRLDEWWHNPDERFIFLLGKDIKLVKISEEGDEESIGLENVAV